MSGRWCFKLLCQLSYLIFTLSFCFTDQEIGTSQVTLVATILITPWHCLHSVSSSWYFGLSNSHPSTMSLVNSFICQIFFLCDQHWASHGLGWAWIGDMVVFLSRAAARTEMPGSKFMASSLVLILVKQTQTHILSHFYGYITTMIDM